MTRNTRIEPMLSLGACCEPHGHCVTCSDEAQRVTVLAVLDDGLSAVVAINGDQREIDISLVDAVQVGQVLLVHGGVALETETPEREA